MMQQKKPMPGVKNSMPGPKALPSKGLAARAPHSKGNVARSKQTGTTAPATDAGGGMGNSSTALHRMIGCK